MTGRSWRRKISSRVIVSVLTSGFCYPYTILQACSWTPERPQRSPGWRNLH